MSTHRRAPAKQPVRGGNVSLIWLCRAEIEHTYKINRRVEAEERALDSAIMVFTSTEQEIDEQWGLYDG